MLKIMTEQSDSGTTVHLCGQFTGEYIPELEGAITGGDARAGKVRIDLSHVTFVDRPAMVFLCSAAGKNVTVENIPSYVRRWIEQERVCGPTADHPKPPWSSED